MAQKRTLSTVSARTYYDIPYGRADQMTITHNDVTRESFTAQAEAFAATPWIADSDRAAELVSVAHVSGGERVLDVATGPGYIAEAFARVCREVVGLDLTGAMLDIAKERTRARGISNVTFQQGDVSQLPFPAESFDILVCRLAVHHFAEPIAALAEMARVCRTGGAVVIEDIVMSEHKDRAAYHNGFDRLRDPSHVEAYPISRLLGFLANAGLEVESVNTSTLTIDVEGWLKSAQTPPERANEVRRMLDDDKERDLSGAMPFDDPVRGLCFRHRTATMRGRKLRRMSAA